MPKADLRRRSQCNGRAQPLEAEAGRAEQGAASGAAAAGPGRRPSRGPPRAGKRARPTPRPPRSPPVVGRGSGRRRRRPRRAVPAGPRRRVPPRPSRHRSSAPAPTTRSGRPVKEIGPDRPTEPGRARVPRPPPADRRRQGGAVRRDLRRRGRRDAALRAGRAPRRSWRRRPTSSRPSWREQQGSRRRARTTIPIRPTDQVTLLEAAGPLGLAAGGRAGRDLRHRPRGLTAARTTAALHDRGVRPRHLRRLLLGRRHLLLLQHGRPVRGRLPGPQGGSARAPQPSRRARDDDEPDDDG